MSARRVCKAVVVGALAALAAGCAASGTFSMSAEDNSPAALAKAFQTERKPEAGKPVGGAARVFIVAAGKPRKLVAWDLAAGKAQWTVESDVTSRVAVSAKLVAHLEGKTKLVARGLDDGRVLWSYDLGGKRTFLGVAADGDQVVYVVQDDSGKRTWEIGAVVGGKLAWSQQAQGTLGAPQARGGLVYVPFLTQWLTILDGKTGLPIARIRQEDEAITFVRATSDGITYGSRGVFALDEKSVEGTREGSTYAEAKLPEFVKPSYYFDAFKAVQAGYSAYDRNRILWRANLAGDGAPFEFRNGSVVVFSFRFFFGFDAKTGELKWAHQHPRFDVAAAEHVGPAILYVSQEGELGALDPESGARLGALSRVGVRVLGATFDADGFRPAGEAQAVSTADALAAIVTDKDTRFSTQKMFALEVLGGQPGDATIGTILKVLQSDGTTPPVYQKAGAVLAARRDEGSTKFLIEAMKVHSDFVAGVSARAVDLMARALGEQGKGEAAPVLVAHLTDPATPRAALEDVARALAAVHNPTAIPALRTFLLVYRTDPEFAKETLTLHGVIDALIASGGGPERELVAYVADDERTSDKVAEYARRALVAAPPEKKTEATEAPAGGEGSKPPGEKPKSDAAAEAPKGEGAKAEAPKADAAKGDAPKVPTPKKKGGGGGGGGGKGDGTGGGGGNGKGQKPN